MNNILEIFTDGACQGNPGPGGWAAILVFQGEILDAVNGGEAQTTNNRMELLGAIHGLQKAYENWESFPMDTQIIVISDSKYVVEAFTENWLPRWIANNWKTSQKKPVKNKELWEQLLNLARQHKVQWKWVHGHRGNHFNELADHLAVEAKIQSSRDISPSES